jgi:hypothetical protein
MEVHCVIGCGRKVVGRRLPSLRCRINHAPECLRTGSKTRKTKDITKPGWLALDLPTMTIWND